MGFSSQQMFHKTRFPLDQFLVARQPSASVEHSPCARVPHAGCDALSLAKDGNRPPERHHNQPSVREVPPAPADGSTPERVRTTNDSTSETSMKTLGKDCPDPLKGSKNRGPRSRPYTKGGTTTGHQHARDSRVGTEAVEPRVKVSRQQTLNIARPAKDLGKSPNDRLCS
jgi:hypothetical protein